MITHIDSISIDNLHVYTFLTANTMIVRDINKISRPSLRRIVNLSFYQNDVLYTTRLISLTHLTYHILIERAMK